MSDDTFTQADLDALEKAIYQGVLQVKYTDKEIRYRSLDDMIKARDLLRHKLGLDTAPRGTRRVAQFSKDL